MLCPDRTAQDRWSLIECPPVGSGLAGHSWEVVHPGFSPNCPHCAQYCVRASVEMVNRGYLGDLSQDRVSLQGFLGQGQSDLGHNATMDIEPPLSWALQLGGGGLTSDLTPTWAEIADAVVAYRPVLLGVPMGGPVGHCVVIGGVATSQQGPLLPILNPEAAGAQWWTDAAVPKERTAFPSKALAVVQGLAEANLVAQGQDPANPYSDPDGDAVLTIDEVRRFGTNPNVANSDGLDGNDFVYVDAMWH